MICFKKFFLLHEAIRLKDAKKRQLISKHSGAYKIQIINDIFGYKDRLVFDLDVTDQEVGNRNPIIAKINLIFYHYYPNISIQDEMEYKTGIVYDNKDKDKKQPRKIGKLLASIKTQEASMLLDAFKKDPARSTKQSQYKVVISRHPYDVAGMSTDRNWRSCMTLGIKNTVYPDKDNKPGGNNRYVANDIKEGSIIAYLVSNNDRNKGGKLEIRRPLSRILMKPFVNIENSHDVAYSIGNMYGAIVSKFYTFIENWIKTNLNKNTQGKKYAMSSNLYSDDDRPVNFMAVRGKDDIANRIFFDELVYNNDKNGKYQNFFEILALYGSEVDTTSELKIIFRIPDDVPLEAFSYERSGYPKYISKILDIDGLPFYRQIQSIQSFPNIRNIVIEYLFSGHPLEGYEDEDTGKTIPLQQDDIEVSWEEVFRKYHIRDIDYAASYKEIIQILKTADINSEKEEEKIGLQKLFEQIYIKQENVSPNLKEMIKEVDDELPQYLKTKEYFDSLHSLSLEELVEVSKTNQYRTAMDSAVKYIKKTNEVIKRLASWEGDLSNKFPALRGDASKIFQELKANRFPFLKNQIRPTFKSISNRMQELYKYMESHSREDYEYLKDVINEQEHEFRKIWYNY